MTILLDVGTSSSSISIASLLLPERREAKTSILVQNDKTGIGSRNITLSLNFLGLSWLMFNMMALISSFLSNTTFDLCIYVKNSEAHEKCIDTFQQTLNGISFCTYLGTSL